MKKEVHISERKYFGRWGQLHLDYLKEYKRNVYLEFLRSGELEEYLAGIEETAQDRINLIVKQMAEKNGIDEKLKAEDPMEWVGLMNNCRMCAEEFICSDLIYV